MEIGPNLLTSMDPPELVIRFYALEPGPCDERKITVRIKARGEKALNYSRVIDRYTPEWSVLRGIAHALQQMESSQSMLNQETFRRLLDAGVNSFAEPF